MILSTENLTLSFGGLVAVEDLSIQIGENELVGLIGPNGAGKTTVFNLLTGVYPPTSGSFTFLSEKIEKKNTYQLVRQGIARTFQNIRLFKNMSILNNVLSALNFNMHYSIGGGMFRLPSYWREEKKAVEEALELLKIFQLDEYASWAAGALPYGKQRKLEIARAMATNPKLLLLDEPAAGMNPIETEELMETIELLRKQFPISILLIEHDMKLVLGICERLFVMDHGRLIAQGNPKEVVNHPQVIRAYLGEEEEDDVC